jgi:membrane protein YdbS with pleckstrin-like domain
MYCYRCGNRLPEESLFCNRCGTRVMTTPERVRRVRPAATERSTDPKKESSRVTEAFPHPADDDEYPDYSEPDDDHEEAAEWDAETDEPEERDPDDAEDELEAEDELDEEAEDDEEGEEELPPGPYRGPGEKVIFSINPAFYPVTTGYVLSTFVALLFAALVAYFKLGIWLALGGAVVLFVPSIIRHIRHLHTIFTLTTIKLEISEGLFSKSTRNIPLRHIQDVSVRENFKERLLGIGDIIVDTPAMETKLTLNNVNEPRLYADMILEQLERWT